MSEDQNCIFCRIIAKKIPSRIVYEDDSIIGFEDVSPQAPTHLLVVPRKHLTDIHSMHESDRELIGSLFLCAKKIATERGLAENGYRMVINNGAGAGQSVFHLHLHLLSGRKFSWPPG